MMLLVFTLDDWRCALDISVVERVYRAVAVTSLPAAPEIILGIIDVRGSLLPVLDIRKRFRLPQKQLTPDDRFIIARTAKRRVALVADGVSGVVACIDGHAIAANAIVPGLEYVEGVVRTPEGMILVHDLDRFLSLEEEAALDRAMEGR